MRTAFVFSLILFVNISDAKTQWQYYYEFSELGSSIYDIEILNENVIYIGRKYNIDKSTDFGISWNIVYDSTGADGAGFYDIEFVDENYGFATKLAGIGACLATENGGETWESVIPVFGEYSPATNNVCIAAPGHIYLTAGEGYYDGKVLYTHDNFITLENVRPALYNFDQQVADIDCINKDTCIAIHGTPYCCDGGWEFGIYKTTNGCETWEVVGYFTDGLDVQFVSESAIYILGLFFISKSMDGGTTWEVIKEEAFTGSTFSSMKFLNDTVGYLTEWKYPENYIYFTDDGGETWIENTIDSMPAGKISAIDCLNADSCFFGSSRKLYRNFSDGVTTMQNGNTSDNILNIFPNPAKDIVYLKLSVKENNHTIQTLNVIGELIELNFQNNQADISHLPPGIYFTEVITEQGRAVQKWVKM